MKWPWRREEHRAEVIPVNDPARDEFLRLLKDSESITKADALNIPSFAACTAIICGTVAMLPIKLYRESSGDVAELEQDPRVKLLNDETGDLLDSYQMKLAWVEDYLLEGAGYIYINRERNSVQSLHYVENRYVASIAGTDPIFKATDIFVNGAKYRDFEFLKIARRSKDGVTGRGILEDSREVLCAAHNALLYENYLVKTGGNKKGFLMSESRLEKSVLDDLKKQFRAMYSNNDESVVVLNKGISFKEASNTSVEMQLNENKKSNAIEMCKLFQLPPPLIDGTASDDEQGLAVKVCFNPILTAIETALNRDLLLESEKPDTYFAFDRTDLLKGDILKRFTAYKMAVESNIMGVDEVRYREDLPKLGLNFVRLGLQDVLYDPKTGDLYTPNTDKTFTMRRLSGKKGETNED